MTRVFPEASPVFPFMNGIAASILNIAPEKEQQLNSILTEHSVRFVMDQCTDAVFRARLTDGRNEVRCSVYGAEIIWAATYSYVAVHRLLKDNGGRELRFADEPRTAAVPQLLEFAFERRYGQQATESWPAELPAPRLYAPGSDLDDQVLSTELWLCALAWIQHHELAHIALGHLAKAEQEVSDELAADDAATAWLMSGVTEPAAKLKRSLGIAIALVAVAGFSFHRNSRVPGKRTHPPAGERIMRALSHSSFEDDHQAQELACVALKIHLDRNRLRPTLGPFKSVSECLFAYCRTMIDWELGRSNTTLRSAV
jgi:hypothetical protein